MRAGLLLALLLACGGKPVPSGDAAPTCAEVAAHLVDLAERDNAAPTGAELGGAMHAELERKCRDQAWSPARRRCLRDAPVQDATLGCPAR